MNRLGDPFHLPPERVWLHKTQWRTVAALLLLLAAVVASLALASGFWWAIHSHPVGAVRTLAPDSPAPVATVTIPIISASVVEVYPLTAVPSRPPRIVVRSPGGIVADLPVRIGQRVAAGQLLARLEEAPPVAPIARVPTPTAPDAKVA